MLSFTEGNTEFGFLFFRFSDGWMTLKGCASNIHGTVSTKDVHEETVVSLILNEQDNGRNKIGHGHTKTSPNPDRIISDQENIFLRPRLIYDIQIELILELNPFLEKI